MMVVLSWVCVLPVRVLPLVSPAVRLVSLDLTRCVCRRVVLRCFPRSRTRLVSLESW